MLKRRIHIASSSTLGKFCVAILLLLFINVSVLNQYFDISSDSIIELCEEEEEGEEENKEENEKELELNKFLISEETLVISVVVDVNKNESKVRIDNHIEVFTPPPELS
jgi:hypothetical protein